LYAFQQASPVSLLANPLVLPAQPAVMVLGGLAVLLGALWAPLGQITATLAWPFVAYTIRVVELLAQLPFASLSFGSISPGWVLLFYFLLLGWTFWGAQLQTYWVGPFGQLSPTRWAGPGLACLAVLSILTWRAAWSAPDGRLHLAVLNVSAGGDSGEALLIRTPGGRNLLVGGGPSSSRLSDALGRRLPPFDRRLDWLVVAGVEDEQLRGLPANLDRFPPGQVLWAGLPQASASARELQAGLIAAKIPIHPAEAGQALDLGEGAVLRTLAVTSRGAVLLLEWGNFQALLPVGLDFDSLEALASGAGQSSLTALLLVDGGSAPLNPPEWIAAWQPQVVLLNVAPGDRRGLPDPETLQAMQGYPVLRTDRNGWIELVTDGEQVWLEVERR
jgi:competence protein ComEC